MKIEELKNKKVLILGIGREGLDTLKYLKEVFPKKIFAIADQKEELDSKTKKAIEGMDVFLGKDYLKNVKDFDVIIKSPGIPFFKYKDKLTSQTELFFDNCPGKIIGVTGTKGKSTVASLIHGILKGSYLVGNIETPSLSFLSKAKKDDIFVYELSSHQLMNLKKSPHIAVFLNIYPEHLDYYKNFEEYFSAKKNIYKYQSESDYLIFNPEIEPKTKAKKIKIDVNDFAQFLKNNQQFLEITHIDNLIAVLNVAKLFNVPEKDIIKSLNKYKRLPHRLEFVGEFKGIRFYDDSIATIPEAVVYALDSLGDDVETIILGGLDRGIKYDKLVKRIKKSNIKTIIAFPDSGEKIVRNIRSRIYKVDNMKDAVDLAYKHTSKGKICLMSPASPSFNLFKDYKERGDLFKKYINEKAKN
ncbi:MAG TPA: UDP-N-acetylmuramoyl-L-alanine--D-glutamate ligase [Candidatus Pacearchaeota archaeon]|jgi:UDP-N-acetylmuramoylalanine--D-glutamate ligase|nr:UDP-N-acetylmuramoyl-L-alanine--D-glutamate ligase [Candidatus Pacearchaeota archaeon]